MLYGASLEIVEIAPCAADTSGIKVPRFSPRKVARLLGESAAAIVAEEWVRLFEDLLSYAFSAIPRMTLTARDVLNFAGSEEIDLAFWNEQVTNGLQFLPNVIMGRAP